MSDKVKVAIQAGINGTLTTMDFTQLEEIALEIKTRFVKHYAGDKLPVTEFFPMKNVEAIYNLRSWNEGTKAGPNALNKLAKKAA